MTPNTGLHLVVDLTCCACDETLLYHAPALRDATAALVFQSGLNSIDEVFHQFAGGGVTGTFVLTESHLNLHTWPEAGIVSLDAYVSNFKHDNSDRVRELVATIVTMFSPRDVSIREVIRGEKIFSEKLNPSVSLQIAAGVLRYQHSSEIQRIEVFQTPSFGRLLRLDEHTQFSEFDEFIYHESIVHPALVTHERPTDVLILGGGDGGAAEEVLKHYSINTLTVVEIDRKVVEVAKRFFPDMQNGAFDSDKIQLVYADAWNYVAFTDRAFDAIILDLPDPLGVAERLYSRDFIYMCSRLLRPGGAIAMHLGSPIWHASRIRDLVGRASSVFSFTTPYLIDVPVFGGLWSMLLCYHGPGHTRISATEVDSILKSRGISDLRFYDSATHQAIFSIPRHLRHLFD